MEVNMEVEVDIDMEVEADMEGIEVEEAVSRRTRCMYNSSYIYLPVYTGSL